MPKSELLPSLSAPLLFFKEGQEKFTLVTLYKKVTVSESLPRSLQKSDCDRFALFQQRIAISLFRSQKNKRFALKPKERIPNSEINRANDGKFHNHCKL